MPISVKKSKANKRWDSENMAYQTVKVRKETLQAFREKCKERNQRVNTVLREYMESYAGVPPESAAPETAPDAGNASGSG